MARHAEQGLYIGYDNVLVKAALTCTCALKANVEVASLARLAGGIVEAEVPVDHRHVKGHCGHPWNELADVVASGAFRQAPVTPWPPWMLAFPRQVAREVA
eukprot:11184040-Lingulodinium_polyedra.AAC.1